MSTFVNHSLTFFVRLPSHLQHVPHHLFVFMYRVFIKYCVFYLKVVIFPNSASFAAALVFYLPSVCTHTETEGKQRKARVRNILKYSKKNTIFNEHPVPMYKESPLNARGKINQIDGLCRCRPSKNDLEH